MTYDPTNNRSDKNPDIHLRDEPEIAEMESLLDQLAKHDADAMPDGLESSVLDAISRAIAPTPIAIESVESVKDSARANRMWTLRLAAAAALATGTTLLIVAAQPWANSGPTGTTNEIALVSFEQDMDAFFALETLEDGDLSEAVTEWEIWAQSVDMDIDSTLTGYDWYESETDNGAL